MKKVIFINHSRYLHGAETVMFQVINAVFSSPAENVFICQPAQYPHVSDFEKKLAENGYNQLITLPYQNIGYGLPYSALKIINNLFALIKISFFIRKNKIDTVFSNTSINFFGIMAAIFTGKKHIWHFHESLPNDKWNKTLKPLYRIVLSYKKNTSVFISETQKKQWQSHLDFHFKNSVTVYNPVKTIIPAGKPEKNKNGLTFGYLGSWSALKNIPFLIETFAELNKKYPEIKLVMNKYGGELGEEAQTVAASIEAHQNSNIVSDTKYNDSSRFFADTDVLLLASLWETMPLVSLEAMSMEKCVIMTGNSGMHELFDEAVHCLYIDPQNRETLYKAMEKILLDSELRLSLAKNGCEKMKKCDFNRKFAESFITLLL
jgi:glycosyltransferase involved in cell wall biosynthesis